MFEGFDFVGVDAELSELLAAFFAVAFGGTGIASGVVRLAVGFGLEGLESSARGERDGGDDDAGGAADLFGGEQFAAFDLFARREFLPRDGAEQLAQDDQEQVAMDAMPAAAFEVIQAEFLLRFAEAVFDRPATESNAEDHPQSPAIATGDAVGEEEFHFAGEYVASHNQSALRTHAAVVVSLPPAGGPADLPDFAALVRVADVIPLRCLFVEGGRVLGEVADFARRLLVRLQSRKLLRSSDGVFGRPLQHFRLACPDASVAGNLDRERLLALLQGIQKRRVPTRQFIARPAVCATEQ